MTMLRFITCCVAVLFSHAAMAVEVKEVVSSKGIKAWLVEEHAVPLVAVRIVFTDSGYASDSAEKLGRANLAAALFTEGAGELDARSFNEAIESHAISLLAGVDEDLFTITMETLSEHNNEAFSYLGLALTNPRLDDESVVRTRRQALSILSQQQQRPGYQLWQTWQQKAFAGHPYSQPPVGTKDTIEALSKPDIARYYTRHLTRENMHIAVVGDITPEELAKLLDEHVAPLPARFNPEKKPDPATLATWDTPYTIPFAMPQAMIMFGLPGIARHDKDFFNGYVLNHLLAGGGSLTSKLGKELREKRGLTYGISAYLDLAKYAPVWRGSFATKKEQADDALNVLQSTLREVASKGVSEKELADAKQYITGSFVLQLDSNANIARYLISMQLFDLGTDYLEKRNQMVQAVTLKEVNALAARLLTVHDMRIVMIGKDTP